jgi:hypothetical protein
MIADDILRELPDAVRPQVARAILAGPFVKIQNVADYFYMASPQEEWKPADFPCVAPPWPCWWMEYTTPPYSNSEGRRIALPRYRWGIAVSAHELDRRGRDGLIQSFHKIPVGRTKSFNLDQAIADTEAARWVMTLQCISPDLRGAGVLQSLLVSPAGTLGSESVIAAATPPGLAEVSDDPGQVLANVVGSGPKNVLALSLSFIHCANTRVVETVTSPALAKARQKRARLPLMRYYTLDIGAMRTVLESVRATQAGSLPKALHICRGHFKDYRDGPGLFGRQPGLWWWRMQTRGTAKAGEVRKDYRVHAPAIPVGPMNPPASAPPFAP